MSSPTLCEKEMGNFKMVFTSLWVVIQRMLSVSLHLLKTRITKAMVSGTYRVPLVTKERSLHIFCDTESSILLFVW